MQGQPEGPISERFLDFVYQPLIGPQGNVTGIFVQGSDTTERSLAERRLSDSNFLAAHPGMTVSAILETLPMNARSYVARFAEGMRKSGIPD